MILNNTHRLCHSFCGSEILEQISRLTGSGPGSLQGAILRKQAGVFDSCLRIYFSGSSLIRLACWQEASVPHQGGLSVSYSVSSPRSREWAGRKLQSPAWLSLQSCAPSLQRIPFFRSLEIKSSPDSGGGESRSTS